jgi:large subunit ribosomal protein L3
MTRIFTEEGLSIPVTVIEALPNRISQLKEKTNDGYNAVQLSSGNVKKSRMTKPIAGHFASTKIKPGKNINEFRILEGDQNDYKLGMELTVNIFEKGQKVDVTGKTIGKGFAGTVKRHNFSMQDATHGNSLSHRAPGSIGQNQTPGRVFKGKKMAGHMGNVQRTVQNLEIIDIDLERNLLMIKGAIPGHPGSDVIIKLAVKRNDQVITINRQTETSPAEEASKETSPETSPAEEASKETSPETSPAEEASKETSPETSPAEEASKEAPGKKVDSEEN